MSMKAGGRPCPPEHYEYENPPSGTAGRPDAAQFVSGLSSGWMTSAARRSVLHPLFSATKCKDPAAELACYGALVPMWRERVAELSSSVGDDQSLPWLIGPESLWALRNCRPYAADVSRKTRYCWKWPACPFCHMRAVAEPLSRLSDRVVKGPLPEGAGLVAFSSEKEVPRYAGAVADGWKVLSADWRSEADAFECLYGAVYCRVVPLAKKLRLVRSGFILHAGERGPRPAGSSYADCKAEPLSLAYHGPRVFAYQTALMRGPVGDALVVLRNLKGRRQIRYCGKYAVSWGPQGLGGDGE